MTQGPSPQPQATVPSPKEQDKSDKSESDPQPVPVDALAGTPTLIDFLHTVPAPLVALLIRLAVPVSSLRHVAQIFSWQAPWVDSWLLIAAWWTVVLFASSALRYFLPVVIGLALVYFRRPRPQKDVSLPMNEVSVQAAVRDIGGLLILLPSSPNLPSFLSSSELPSSALFRVCALAFVPYVVLAYLVPVRVLVGVFGTVILTYRAPFARLLRAALWRSAFVRWAVYRTWAELTGLPMPCQIPAPTANAKGAAQSANTTVTAQLRFAFTVYENQRWWMGLDWTAALLPGERPSWCNASQAPLPPPVAFALPAPTTAFLSVDGVPDAREQRTATWAWAEPEWRVIVCREGEPSGDTEGAEKDKAEETDGDGWVYGDNKWESHSGKGGLGKYTRCRRWTRVAVLTETTERVGPGPTGVLREGGQVHPLDALVGSDAKEKTVEKDKEQRDNLPSQIERRTSVVLGAVGGGLKQRLQAAVSGTH